MAGMIEEARRQINAATQAIEALNPSINAVLWVDPEPVIGTGELGGSPVLVKDCIDWGGRPTTHGSSLFSDRPAAEDAECVRRLREAGATLLGKTNLNEFCFGATGENWSFGDCCNPWDPRRIPGGSSGGSAAAVAAGIVSMALGTDTGGSVRVPAALCGVVALRPTLGRVSNHGVLSVSTITDTVGPIGATVADTARLYKAIAGYDERDPHSFRDREPLLDYLTTDLRGLRIGLPRSFFFESLHEEIEQAVEDAAKLLEALGCELVDVSLGASAGFDFGAGFRFVLADVADARRDIYPRFSDRIGPEVRRRIELGHQVSGPDYAHCIRLIQQLQVELRMLFDHQVDALLTPTTPVTAPLWEDARDMVETTRLVARNTYDLGAAGVPSLTVPCGYDRHGLPIGMQLTASWRQESLLFRLAGAYEARMDDRRRPAPA